MHLDGICVILPKFHFNFLLEVQMYSTSNLFNIKSQSKYGSVYRELFFNCQN